MSIAALLQAAEYLERREREAEHGYASTLPMPHDYHSHRSTKRPKSRKTQGNRTTHNELEKNRRAHLRNCLEALKEIVPVGPDASRHTTLGLLTKAQHFIKNLEGQERRHRLCKDQLYREHGYLTRRVEQLGGTLPVPIVQKRRSASECSTSTSSVLSSTSESDEVDILGYSSNHSDTDDHSSVESAASDGGISVTTRRLEYMETV